MNKKKNILFITSTLKIGGAEKVISDLMLGLLHEGYNPVLVCLKTLDYWGEYLRKRGIECHTLGIRRQLDVFRLSKLIPLSLQIRPAIIYSLDHRDALFWSRLLAFFLGCPHILSQHSLRIAGAEAPDRFIYELMIKATTPLSAKIVVCSKSVRNYFMSIGIPGNKIKVIHNGVSTNEQKEPIDTVDWRSKLSISSDGKLIGIVAALRPTKDHRVFLKAAKQVLEHCPQTYFAIIGDGYLRSYLEEKARSLRISQRVFFMGNITPANGIIRALDIGVLSSKKEAFPMVILEYMEAGIPVISTNSGGPSEMVLDGKTGFLVPVNRPALMAQKMIYLLKNRQIATQMGQEGRKRVKQHFSLDRMINQNMVLFHQFIK